MQGYFWDARANTKKDNQLILTYGLLNTVGHAWPIVKGFLYKIPFFLTTGTNSYSLTYSIEERLYTISNGSGRIHQFYLRKIKTILGHKTLFIPAFLFKKWWSNSKNRKKKSENVKCYRKTCYCISSNKRLSGLH